MGRTEEDKPVAFMIALGPPRKGKPDILKSRTSFLQIPRNQRTVYVIGNDANTGKGFIRRFNGDKAQYGDVPVIEMGIDRKVAEALVGTYNPELAVRSPRTNSSLNIPFDNITYDAADSGIVAALLARLDRISVGGQGSDETQIESVMALAVQLEALHWLPEGPHQFKPTKIDDGILF